MGIHFLQPGIRLPPDFGKGWTAAFGATERFCETAADEKTHTENQCQDGAE